jgi:hypothetical protein
MLSGMLINPIIHRDKTLCRRSTKAHLNTSVA